MTEDEISRWMRLASRRDQRRVRDARRDARRAYRLFYGESASRAGEDAAGIAGAQIEILAINWRRQHKGGSK